VIGKRQRERLQQVGFEAVDRQKIGIALGASPRRAERECGDPRRRFDTTSKSRRQLLGVAAKILDRDGRVIGPVDANSSEQRMASIFAQALASELSCGAQLGIHDTCPSWKAPRARSEEHARGHDVGESARFVMNDRQPIVVHAERRCGRGLKQLKLTVHGDDLS
jgi:hypothetical protein